MIYLLIVRHRTRSGRWCRAYSEVHHDHETLTSAVWAETIPSQRVEVRTFSADEVAQLLEGM